MIFWRLGYSGLLDPDEAHYAQLTREMMRSGNWMVPTLDGEPYIDKPVLFHWLQGLSIRLLGETEFAGRLPTALAAVALLLITRWAGRSLLNPTAGGWAALMLATMPLTFALGSVALFDMLFTVGLFGAVACLIVASERRSRSIEGAGYLLLTLAVMTKGPVAWLLMFLFVLTSHAAGQEARARLAWLRWRSGMVLVLLAASPWFLWMWREYGDQFVERYVLAGNLWYFTQPLHWSDRAVSYSFYIRAFAGGLFPWTWILLAAVALSMSSRRSAATATERLLWIWIGTVVLFFTTARFKLDHYIYPVAPACALLTAAYWQRMAQARREGLALRGSVCVLGVVLIAGGIYLSRGLFGLDLRLPASAALLPACLAASGVALLMQSLSTGTPLTPIPLIVMLSLIDAIAVGVGLPVLERTRPISALSRELARRTPTDAPVALYQVDQWRASLRYYLDRPLHRLDDVQQVQSFLAAHPSGYVLLLRRQYESLKRLGVPIRTIAGYECVAGTSGRGLRKQRWDYLLVVTSAPASTAARAAEPR